MDKNSDQQIKELLSNPDTQRKGFEMMVREYSEQLYWQVRRIVLTHEDSNDVLQNAQGKLDKKNLDMIVANDVTAPGAGFDVDTNIVTFLTREKTETLPCLPKRQVAEELLDRVMKLRETN